MKKFLIAMLSLTGCHLSQPTYYRTSDKTETADQTPPIAQDAQPIGSPDAGERLDMSVHVGLRDEDKLDAFLADITDPTSPNFGRAMTHDEFVAKHMPSAQELDAVRAELSKRGIEIDGAAHGAVLHAHASVDHAERAFNVRLRHYEDTRNRRTIRAPDGPISLPAGLNIVAVHGLATPPIRAPKHVVGPIVPGDRVGNLIPYKAKTLQTAYNLPVDVTGDGAVIGLLELDGYKASDIASYAALSGLGMPKLTNINIGGYRGQILSGGAQLEVTLDIELALVGAPKAAEIVVYGADQGASATAWFDLWNEIANPTKHALVKTISVSWGTPEDYAAAATKNSENVILKQMAAQGQTAWVASGDSGAYGDGRKLVTDDPSSQRWAVAVGGTRLSVYSTGVRIGESAWIDGGGGLSSYWRAPPWQQNVDPHASNNLRNVPDVSANADPVTGYAIMMNGSWVMVGGTSASTPLWAGYWAAIEQARAAKGLPPMGFAAPVLWSLGGNKSPAFNDISDGTTNGYYAARSGYDHTSGFGSMNGAALYDALVTQPANKAAAPAK
jgi:subtilase family serine protease